MQKVIISATVKEETRDKAMQLAQKEERSFSNMIDLLLCIGLIEWEKQKEKK